MKTPRLLIPGAVCFGLLFSIAITSCSTGGSSAKPEDTSIPAASAAAPASAPVMANVPATPVSLVTFYNMDGIVPDGTQFGSGVDGEGYACSSNILGESFSWKGVLFQLGTANKMNVVNCGGQAIPLPAGTFSKLEMLAIGVNGAQESQNFAIGYADKSMDQTFTQSLSDWYSPDGYTNEAQAIDMDYRDQSDGTRADEPFYIYGYVFNLNSGGTANKLILPSNTNLDVFAITLVQ